MKLELRAPNGSISGSVTVDDKVFDVDINPVLTHQVVVSQLSNDRQGNASTKTRSEVSGGGAKPRPQKGSGRSRQGSIRSPLWKGGGVTFGPNGRSYSQKIPKKMRRKSICGLISDKARAGQIIVVEDLILPEFKTKHMYDLLNTLVGDSRILLVADRIDQKILKCARNIPTVKMLPVRLLSSVDLSNNRILVMTLESVREVERLWGS
jgi:large subunit ribosomal protein L4